MEVQAMQTMRPPYEKEAPSENDPFEEAGFHLHATSLKQLATQGWELRFPQDLRHLLATAQPPSRGEPQAEGTEQPVSPRGTQLTATRLHGLAAKVWPEAHDRPVVGFLGLSGSGKSFLLRKLLGHDGERTVRTDGLSLHRAGEGGQDLVFMDTEGPNRSGQLPDGERATRVAALQELAYHVADALVVVVRHTESPKRSRTTSWPEQMYLDSLLNKLGLPRAAAKTVCLVHNFYEAKNATYSEALDHVRTYKSVRHVHHYCLLADKEHKESNDGEIQRLRSVLSMLPARISPMPVLYRLVDELRTTVVPVFPGVRSIVSSVEDCRSLRLKTATDTGADIEFSHLTFAEHLVAARLTPFQPSVTVEESDESTTLRWNTRSVAEQDDLSQWKTTLVPEKRTVKFTGKRQLYSVLLGKLLGEEGPVAYGDKAKELPAAVQLLSIERKQGQFTVEASIPDSCLMMPQKGKLDEETGQWTITFPTQLDESEGEA